MRQTAVVWALAGVTAASAVEPHVPLCRQLAPDPDLMIVLNGVRPEWLGLPVTVKPVRPEADDDLSLPMAVRPAAAGTGVGSVHIGTRSSGLPSAVAPATPGSNGIAAVRPARAETDGLPGRLTWAPQPSELAGGVHVPAGTFMLPPGVNLPPGLSAVPGSFHGAATSLAALPSSVPTHATTAMPTVSAGVASVLARLRAGDDSADLQACLAALSKADLVAAMITSAGWQRADELLAMRIAGILLDRGELDPTQPESLPPGTIRWVADCLSERLDARCVPLYQAMLRPFEAERAEGWVQALYGLGMHYRRTGDLKQSAAVWLDAGRYTKSPAVQDDYRLEAAWDLRMAGDAVTADAIEDQLLKSTSGAAWTICLVTYSRAQRLLLAGKHAELRVLLSSPLAPLGELSSQARADVAGVQVALDGLLADSYAKTGERELVAAQSRKVLDGYAALANQREGSGLENVVAAARKRLAELSDQGKG